MKGHQEEKIVFLKNDRFKSRGTERPERVRKVGGTQKMAFLNGFNNSVGELHDQTAKTPLFLIFHYPNLEPKSEDRIQEVCAWLKPKNINASVRVSDYGRQGCGRVSEDWRQFKQDSDILVVLAFNEYKLFCNLFDIKNQCEDFKDIWICIDRKIGKHLALKLKKKTARFFSTYRIIEFRNLFDARIMDWLEKSRVEKYVKGRIHYGMQ